MPPVAVPSMQGPRSSSSVHISGTDRLFHVKDISKFQDSTVSLDVAIVPSVLARLEKLAEAYQRITYRSLKFRVVPQVSTSTAGGYVTSFVRDVSDKISSDQFGLSKITAQEGSQTCKWWETAQVAVKNFPDLLYTSYTKGDLRFSSPGRFVVATDGQSTQAGSLTVFCDWDVTLSSPSLEAETTEKNPTVRYDLMIDSNSTGYISSLQGMPGADQMEATSMVPGCVVGEIYDLPSPMAYLFKEAVDPNKNITGMRNFWSVKIIASPSTTGALRIVPYETATKEIFKNVSAYRQFIIRAGDVLTLVPTVPLNIHRGLQYLCHATQLESSELNLDSYVIP